MRSGAVIRGLWPIGARAQGRARALAPVLGYGMLLALGTALLSAVDHVSLVRRADGAALVALVGAACLALGIYLGHRMFAPLPAPPPGNPAAAAALGLSARERAVLVALADGGSNKEIARTLGVSPNTVKTHAANLYAKLGVRRRTEAVARGRALGLIA